MSSAAGFLATRSRAVGVRDCDTGPSTSADAASELPDVPVYGRGAGLYPDLLSRPVLEAVPGAQDAAPPVEWQPHAASLGLAAAAALAHGIELSSDTSPLYLRESDAKVPGPRKKATA